MTDRPWRLIDGTIATWLLIAALTTAAFWIGVGPSGALVAGLWMFGLTAVLAFGRDRSVSVRTILGIGDERERDLYTRAMAAAGTVLGLGVTAGWLGSVALGTPSEVLFALTIVFSGTFLGAAILLAQQD
jgi:hypothetical protein